MNVHVHAMQTAGVCRARLDVAGLDRIVDAQVRHRHDTAMAERLRWPRQRKRALRLADDRFLAAVTNAPSNQTQSSGGNDV